jgi:hypothetical protein
VRIWVNYLLYNLNMFKRQVHEALLQWKQHCFYQCCGFGRFLPGSRWDYSNGWTRIRNTGCYSNSIWFQVLCRQAIFLLQMFFTGAVLLCRHCVMCMETFHRRQTLCRNVLYEH